MLRHLDNHCAQIINSLKPSLKELDTVGSKKSQSVGTRWDDDDDFWQSLEQSKINDRCPFHIHSFTVNLSKKTRHNNHTAHIRLTVKSVPKMHNIVPNYHQIAVTVLRSKGKVFFNDRHFFCPMNEEVKTTNSFASWRVQHLVFKWWEN